MTRAPVTLTLLLLLAGCVPRQSAPIHPAMPAAAAAPSAMAAQAPSAAPPSGDCPVPASGPVDFKTQVVPLMMRRCSPCHFPGGKMYSRLPFDKAKTLRELGTRLFTRITQPDEQALLVRFLAQESTPAGPAAAASTGSPTP